MFRTFAGISSFFLTIGVSSAQTLAPLGQPRFYEGAMFADRAAILDLNRDGSQDVLVPSFLMGLFMTTLDEDGNKLASRAFMGTPGVSNNNGIVPTVIALAAGKIDSDFRDDVVVFTNDGALQYLRNRGSTRIDSLGLAPPVIIDNIASMLAVPSITAYNIFSVLNIDDYDNDGFNDIILAGAQVNSWSGLTNPGFFRLYKGDGTGSFQIHSLPLPGNVIDLEFADLNNDGTRDHFVILTETGGQGAFLTEIHHATFSNGVLSFSNSPQNVNGGRRTSLEIADISGDTNKDYILSTNNPQSTGLSSEIMYYTGDGTGTVGPSWGNLYLPTNITGLGDHIESIKVADLNGDQNDDLLVLRGHSMQGNPSANIPYTMGEAELFVALGPNLLSATFESFPLPGKYAPAWSSQSTNIYMAEPLTSMPNMIRIADLDSNHRPDVVIQGLSQSRVVNGTATSASGGVVLKNLLPIAPGNGGFEKVGDPSGGVATHPARIGFDGGRPTAGNQNFSVTIQNIRGGSLVGLMWGGYAQANFFSVAGLQMHISPEVFGNLATASGTQLGEGFFSYPMPVPNDPTLVGAMGYFQFNYYDAVAGALGATQATGLTLGQ